MFAVADLIQLWPILLAGLVLTVLYGLLPKQRETVVFGSTALGVFLTFAGLIQGAVQDRLKVAFSYSERLNSPDASVRFERAAEALQAVSDKSPAVIDTMFAHENISEPLKFVFNNFDEIGQAVRLRYADGSAACVLFRDIALKYFSTLKPWLDYHRSQTRNWTMYEQYEWLFNRWKSGC